MFSSVAHRRGPPSFGDPSAALKRSISRLANSAGWGTARPWHWSVRGHSGKVDRANEVGPADPRRSPEALGLVLPRELEAEHTDRHERLP